MAAVKAWLGIATTTNDDTIQACITAAGQMWLGNANVGSLNSVVAYSERYDGTGGRRLFLRNTPIRSVAALLVRDSQISPSPDSVQSGYVVDASGKSIALIGYASFWTGIQNVYVRYTAGYDAVPADVAQANTEQVALNFSRRNWIDKSSDNLTQQGGTVYRGWEVTPSILACLNRYTRTALL